MHFAVILERGGPWDWDRPMEGQELWSEHAAFMDGLVSAGFILLGGPLGDGKRVLHAIEAEDEADVRERFSADPWHANGLLSIASVDPWTIRLDGRLRN